MGHSFMYRTAELYFRLQPKRSEEEYVRMLEAQKQIPEAPTPTPRHMPCRCEDGDDGRFFFLNEGGNGRCTVFYCHGGSYVHDFSYFHWRFLQKLTDRTGAVIAAPAYRLAPYGTWKEAFRLILPRYARYAEEHPDRKIILMGDSAGGGLAAALALELDRTGGRMPDETILLSPWMDVRVSDPDVLAKEKDDPWITPSARVCGRYWAGDTDVTDPRVSPMFGDAGGLKRVTVFAGTRELLNPDSVKFFSRLDPEGGSELVIGEGMFHVYPLLPIPEAEPAFDRIVEKIVR